MKNPIVLATVKNLPVAIATFYKGHESAVLTTGTIIFSGTSIAFAVKNSRFILDTIDDAKEILAKEKDSEKRKSIYMSVLRELAPKVLQILIPYAASITCALVNKKQTDDKIAKLTAALTTTQAAITQYQLWEKEAKEELGEDKVAEVNKKVVKEEVKQNPPTEQNTKGTAPTTREEVQTMWRYLDGNTPSRYLWSRKSPNAIRAWAIDQSAMLEEGAYASDNPNDALGINAFYEFLAEGLDDDYTIHAYDFDKNKYWYAKDAGSGYISDLVNIDVSVTEAPDGSPINAFHCNFMPFR